MSKLLLYIWILSILTYDVSKCAWILLNKIQNILLIICIILKHLCLWVKRRHLVVWLIHEWHLLRLTRIGCKLILIKIIILLIHLKIICILIGKFLFFLLFYSCRFKLFHHTSKVFGLLLAWSLNLWWLLLVLRTFTSWIATGTKYAIWLWALASRLDEWTWLSSHCAVRHRLREYWKRWWWLA